MTNIETRSVLQTYAEGQRYFMGKGNINNALARLIADLNEHDIDYLVIGAIALMAYGYPRFTEDIDLILDQNGIDRFHSELIGLGYAPAFQGARKRLRSTRDGTPIEFISSGAFEISGVILGGGNAKLLRTRRDPSPRPPRKASKGVSATLPSLLVTARFVPSATLF